MLELTVLTVPDCPNEAILLERLDQALDGHPEVRITTQVIDTEADAARWGMHGSPTLLINGVDAFAAQGAPASVSCRLYRDEAGPTGGAPSVAALREALGEARSGALPQVADSVIPAVLAQAAGRGGRGRVAPVEGGLRAVHQRVLRSFAETGRPPAPADLDEVAMVYGRSGAVVMADLHTADLLRLDAGDAIIAAYPFSPVPTRHRVQIDDGPQVHAMCAVDALGMAAMLGRDVTINATEPGTGHPITVTVPAHANIPGGGGPVVWAPESAVVFYGQQEAAACCADPQPEDVAPAAAEVCCDCINFFTTPAAAQAWSQAHPHITGQVLAQRQAWQIGVHIFGPLLQPFV
ncbi:alkylmercury lyase family protein [Nonomuraea sp. NBC_01738]|uniref:alkylmercury lyase family protein n=1 Tax=Nonomuraea sp. NBC_01738 TaxID=2976003 RepID=UPI002E120086|nr:alkylmercury lyase family protein [Nonomuraea sp. NBC_01738]